MANDGTDFQNTFQDCLQQLQETESVYWHRFTDTKAARNFVKAQPGDFMALAAGMPHLFELKSTVAGTSLKEFLATKSGRHQKAEARKWVRAGGMAWYVREDKMANEINFHSASVVALGGYDPIYRCRPGELFETMKTKILRLE